MRSAESDGASLVTLQRTDRYRGLAFLAFRFFFAMRARACPRLKQWAETGLLRAAAACSNGPITQLGFCRGVGADPVAFSSGCRAGRAGACRGVDDRGRACTSSATMAAFRVMGASPRAHDLHPRCLAGSPSAGRPLRQPFRGCLRRADGAPASRPSSSPIAIALQRFSRAAMAIRWLRGILATARRFSPHSSTSPTLVPVWKFDGGQVLAAGIPRAGCRLAFMSFATPARFSLAARPLSPGCRCSCCSRSERSFAVLSLITTGSGRQGPRYELKTAGRLRARRALRPLFLPHAFAVHFYGVMWAMARLT